MKARARRIVFWILVAAAVLTALGGWATQPRNPLIVAVMTAVLGAVAVAFRWGRR